MVHVFVVVLLISNLAGGKITALGPINLFGYRASFPISGAQILFPITYVFGGSQPASTIVKLIVSGYLGKVLYETLATPATYVVVNALKRGEGVDVFDRDADFSPFAREQASPAEAARQS